MVGLEDLKGLVQPKPFCDLMRARGAQWWELDMPLSPPPLERLCPLPSQPLPCLHGNANPSCAQGAAGLGVVLQVALCALRWGMEGSPWPARAGKPEGDAGNPQAGCRAPSGVETPQGPQQRAATAARWQAEPSGPAPTPPAPTPGSPGLPHPQGHRQPPEQPGDSL